MASLPTRVWWILLSQSRVHNGTYSDWLWQQNKLTFLTSAFLQLVSGLHSLSLYKSQGFKPPNQSKPPSSVYRGFPDYLAGSAKAFATNTDLCANSGLGVIKRSEIHGMAIDWTTSKKYIFQPLSGTFTHGELGTEGNIDQPPLLDREEFLSQRAVYVFFCLASPWPLEDSGLRKHETQQKRRKATWANESRDVRFLVF